VRKSGGGSGRQQVRQKAWAESKKLWAIVEPAIFSRVATYSMNVITQALITTGNLSDLELAAVSFANTFVIGVNHGLMVRALQFPR
jgi:multidrug resistance protein, MATE family